jgi:hypothetical protein
LLQVIPTRSGVHWTAFDHSAEALGLLKGAVGGLALNQFLNLRTQQGRYIPVQLAQLSLGARRRFEDDRFHRQRVIRFRQFSQYESSSLPAPAPQIMDAESIAAEEPGTSIGVMDAIAIIAILMPRFVNTPAYPRMAGMIPIL